MKKTISLILTVLMIVSSFSVMSLVSAKETNVVSSGDTYSGTTGDCTWTYDEDTETLTISGNGKMGNYDYYNNAPWHEYSYKVKSVDISNGVLSLGSFCFSNFENLVEVTIPNSVTSIGNCAFDNCISLKSITMPDSVKYMGDYTFSGCVNLSKVIFSNNIKYIGVKSFSKCAKLVDITVPNGVTRIFSNAFTDCTSLEKIVIPDTVKIIDDDVFNNCTNLKNITLPSNLSKLGSTVFYNCSNLSAINIDINNNYYASIDGNLYSKDKTRLIQYAIGKDDESFIVPDFVNRIERYSFGTCSSLVNITIPNGVGQIGDYAFESCVNLSSIKIPNSVYQLGDCAFIYCTNLLTAELSYGMTYTGNRTFEQCKNLNKLIIPDSITEIGLGCFDYCNNIQTVYYTGDEDKFNSTYLGTLFKNVDVVYNYDLGGSSSNNSSSSDSSSNDSSSSDSSSSDSSSSSSSSSSSTSCSVGVGTSTPIILIKAKSTTIKANNTTKKKLKWTTSNSKVATVSQSGKVTAKSRGTATIKATADDGRNKYTFSCKVIVKQPVTSVKLNKKTTILKVKGNAKQKTVTLKAKVYPNNANNKTVKWSTSKSKIAIVNSKGKVTAKKKGTCYIIATAKDGSKKSAKCKITVK